MIVDGMPCNLYTWLRNIWATNAAVNGCNKGRKWLYLKNLSTITKMQFAESDLGKPSIKSKETVCHAPEGTGSGESKPGYFTLFGLTCWQMEQEATKDLATTFMPV
jgi:hypothetical protein